MYEIAVMNPRPRKRRAKSRKAHSVRKSKRVAKVKRNKKGRFVKGSAPKRRRVRRVNPRKSKARGKRRSVVGYVVGTKRIRRRKMNPRRRHARARRRNPRFSVAGIMPQLKSGFFGGVGGILNSLVIGFVGPKLPASVSSGYPLHAVRIASALGVGMAAKKVAGRAGEDIGTGAMAVAMYLLLKDVAASYAPSLPLGDYQEITLDHPGSLVGAYMNGTQVTHSPQPMDAGVGAYMNGVDAVTEY